MHVFETLTDVDLVMYDSITVISPSSPPLAFLVWQMVRKLAPISFAGFRDGRATVVSVSPIRQERSRTAWQHCQFSGLHLTLICVCTLIYGERDCRWLTGLENTSITAVGHQYIFCMSFQPSRVYLHFYIAQ